MSAVSSVVSFSSPLSDLIRGITISSGPCHPRPSTTGRCRFSKVSLRSSEPMRAGPHHHPPVMIQAAGGGAIHFLDSLKEAAKSLAQIFSPGAEEDESPPSPPPSLGHWAYGSAEVVRQLVPLPLTTLPLPPHVVAAVVSSTEAEGASTSVVAAAADGQVLRSLQLEALERSWDRSLNRTEAEGGDDDEGAERRRREAYARVLTLPAVSCNNDSCDLVDDEIEEPAYRC